MEGKDGRMLMYVLVGGLIVLMFLGLGYLFMHSSKKAKDTNENYGGPVKVVKAPPLDVCGQRCKSYAKWCLSNYGSNDSGRCIRDYKNCLNSCRYKFGN